MGEHHVWRPASPEKPKGGPSKKKSPYPLATRTSKAQKKRNMSVVIVKSAICITRADLNTKKTTKRQVLLSPKERLMNMSVSVATLLLGTSLTKS
jgi:hypothetical protein